jgi:hypothetical protein
LIARIDRQFVAQNHCLIPFGGTTARVRASNFFFTRIDFMRRIGTLLASAFLAASIVGCGGGLAEGPPKDGPTDASTSDFKSEMMKNAEKMQMKGKPKTAPSPTTPEAK